MPLTTYLPIHSPHETAPVILICFNGRGDESSDWLRLGTLSSIYLGLGSASLGAAAEMVLCFATAS